MYQDVFKDMADHINDVLGHICNYTTIDGDVIENISITINTGKPVVTEFNMIAGNIVEGGILISDVSKPSVDDSFTDDLGRKWRVDGVIKVVTGKTYVHLLEDYR